MMTGCASQQPAMQTVTIAQQPQYACAAMAFDAPITLDQPAIDVSRADRGPAAFVGFEDINTSYYDVVNDDRQSTDRSDRFIRESVTERIGTTRR